MRVSSWILSTYHYFQKVEFGDLQEVDLKTSGSRFGDLQEVGLETLRKQVYRLSQLEGLETSRKEAWRPSGSRFGETFRK
jgi:hypothetical protein